MLDQEKDIQILVYKIESNELNISLKLQYIPICKPDQNLFPFPTKKPSQNPNIYYENI